MIISALLLFSCNNEPAKKEKVQTNSSSQKIDLLQTKVLSDRLTLKIPKNFVQMTDEEVNTTYPNPKHRPETIFTSLDGQANVAFHLTMKQRKEEMTYLLETLTDEYDHAPSVDLQSSKLETIYGKEFVVLEFVTSGPSSKIYNLMYVSDINTQIFMATFTCLLSKQKFWQERSTEIMNSMEVL